MTEVFAGLPEQDILLTEFFLEKFLWRHTEQNFQYDLKPDRPWSFSHLSGAFVVVAETSGEERNYWV